MNDGMKVWIDGQVVNAAEARVGVLDHGLLYGDGIFEGMRARGGRLFRPDDHLARMAGGARALHLEIPGGRDHLRSVLEQVVRAHGGDDLYLRLVVTRGVGSLGIDVTSCKAPGVFCIAGELALFPEDKAVGGIAMITASVRRPGSDVLDPRIKSLNYLNNVLAKQQAKRQGADDALLLNAQGNVAEASAANLFVLRGGRLYTPPTADGALDGITRLTVLELCAERGIAAELRSLGRIDLFGADEVFITGTGAGLVRVRSLDGEPIGGSEPSAIFTALRAAHRDRLRG
jgi:branched-chain amino acid aminotransferase